ncbi:MAG TPA: polyamine aminopropyltransferase [Burkholderiales bacterium]|nr:polyamine aminopropyltransferase [Burkholderiales bacterium]
MNLLSKLNGRRRRGPEASVEVSEKDGIRYLHLGSDTIQSGMRITDPDELVLAYTRTMMSFLLFAPRPQRIVCVGLGGGSVSKWLYRHLPQARQTVLEHNARVIVAARQYFGVPPDDTRFQVLRADGAQWIAEHPNCADLILVDGYDGESQVAELATLEFYRAAARALDRDGALVVNLWGSDRHFNEYLLRIETAFMGRVLCVPALQKGNIIVLAFRRRPAQTSWDALLVRARALEKLYGLEFARFVEVMKRLNPHTERGLLI